MLKFFNYTIHIYDLFLIFSGYVQILTIDSIRYKWLHENKLWRWNHALFETFERRNFDTTHEYSRQGKASQRIIPYIFYQSSNDKLTDIAI